MHVLCLGIVQRYLGPLKPRSEIDLRGAGGHQLQYYGTVELFMKVNNKIFRMRAEIADVKHNLLSVGRLEEHGYGVLFLQDQSRITREDWQAEITR